MLDAECGVPRNASIRLRLDRPLLPITAVRQAIRVYTGQNSAPFFTPHYDVLGLEVTFDFASQLQPKTLYQVEIVNLRAFDGAPLADSDRDARWSFMTSARSDRALEPVVPEQEPSCGQIAERMASSCASSSCHGGPTPVMGLRLESVEDLRRTAIDRVAHQTETGDQVGTPFDDPSRFGVAMPIIDPGAAHNSYLVYKLLLLPENLAPCSGVDCGVFANLPGADDCRLIPEIERRRLAEWFVQGAPMPPPSTSSHLDCGFLRGLIRWIDAGARCE